MTGVAPLAGAFALLLSVALLCAGRIATAVLVCSTQALLAAAALGAPGWRLAGMACVAVALNGVLLPLAMQRVLHRTAMSPLLAARIGPAAFWPVALVLSAVVVAAFAQIRPVSSGDGLVLGSTIVLLGLLLVVLRQHPLAPALGLLSSQNGLLLVAAAIPDLPPSAVLLVVLPLLPGSLLADAWLRR